MIQDMKAQGKRARERRGESERREGAEWRQVHGDEGSSEADGSRDDITHQAVAIEACWVGVVVQPPYIR